MKNMPNKDLIITVLIIAVIYLAYQQQENNQSANIIESPNAQQLRSELNHYQALYEQRVEKDLGNEEKFKDLTEQLALCEEIINKPTSEIGTQTELTTEDIIALNKKTEYYQTLAEQKQKTLDLTQQDLKSSQENTEELESLLETKKQELQSRDKKNNEQLRKINLLFDENSQDYKIIDFDGLYFLLQQIAERERERESEIIDLEEVKPTIKYSLIKKKEN